MEYRLEELLDIPLLQDLQEKLNVIYSFPSAIIDNDGKVLTAVAWQDVCTKFHRTNPLCEKECIKSDQYILEHLHEANPAVSYQCPHGLVDNATPIIIDGQHLGNFFTGQFFLEPPDIDFFKQQAVKYGFDQKTYLEAVNEVPIWTKEKVAQYLDFIKGFIEIIAGIGLKQIKEIETNKALVVKDELYKTILHTAMDGYWLVDLQGNLLEVNDTYCRLSGYSMQELLCMNISDLEVLESAKDTATHLQKVIEKGEDRFESMHRHKDGHIFDVEVSVQYQSLQGGRMVVFLRDITERKQAENELIKAKEIAEQNEEKFKSYAQYSPIAIYSTNSKGECVYANNKWLKIAGLTIDESLGNGWVQALHPDDKSFIEENWYKSVQSNGNWNFEYRFINKQGKVTWVEGSATALYNKLNQIFGYLGSNIDITERKKAEEALNQASARLELSLKAAVAGTWDWSIASGEIVWSEQMFDLFGLDFRTASASFETWRAVLHPDDLKVAELRIEEALKNHISLQSDYRVVLPDGNIRWINSIGEGYYNAAGEAQRMIGICQDITERKQAENDLQASKEYLDKIINSVASPIFVKNEKHEFYLVNDAFCKLLNIPAEKLIGHTDFEYLPEEQVKVFIEKDLEVFKTGIENINEEKFTDGAGVLRTLLTRKTLYTDSFGNKFLVGVTNDITELKNVENELKTETFRLNKTMSFYNNREVRMIELKKEVNELCLRLGEEKKYENW